MTTAATTLPDFGVMQSMYVVDCDICGVRYPATVHVCKDGDTWYRVVYCDRCGYERERHKISLAEAKAFFAELRNLSALIRAARVASTVPA